MRNPSRVKNGSHCVNRALASASIGEGIKDAAGDAQTRRTPAAQIGDLRQQSGKSHIFASENIMFADLAVLQGREMAGGHIVHMNQIEARVHIAGHAARGRLDDDPAGRRRLWSRGPTGVEGWTMTAGR